MKPIRHPLTLLLLLIPLAASALRAESPWAALLRADAKALHDTVLANHPGAVDPLNPGFKIWLQEGYQQALDRAARCNSWDGYRFALMAYANGFHDGHLGVGFDLRRDELAWPGFLVGWSDGKVVVRSASSDGGWKDLPAAGSELLSCDGTPSREMIQRDVLAFEGKLDLEAEWQRLTPFLLLDRRNPWRAPRAQRCTFRESGETKERSLDWRPGEVDALWPRILEARSATVQPFAVRDFGPRGIWIAVPTFDAAGDAEAKLADFVARAAGWKDRDPIVFDVRGNGGGNSQWGQDILTRLYGKELLDAYVGPSQGKTYVEWRASAGNLAHIEGLLPRLEAQFGSTSDAAAWGRRIRSGLQQAASGGKPMFRDGDSAASGSGGSVPAKLPASPVAGRVYLLTDGACGSACLDFCDLLRLMPNATHIGRQTFADSVYMELREEPLPSGAAHLGLPIKVYRERERGNNEPYTPQIPFPGDIADTAALERWVSELAPLSPSQ